MTAISAIRFSPSRRKTSHARVVNEHEQIGALRVESQWSEGLTIRRARRFLHCV